MPVTCQFNHAKHRIIGLASGTLAEQDLFDFQRQFSSKPDYDGIFDGTAVKDLHKIDHNSLKKLAGVAAASDRPDKPTKLAIVAPRDLHFGLGRMYESFRECLPQSVREIGVFHTRAEAEHWLDAAAE